MRLKEKTQHSPQCWPRSETDLHRLPVLIHVPKAGPCAGDAMARYGIGSEAFASLPELGDEQRKCQQDDYRSICPMGTHGVFKDLGIIWHNVRHGTEEPSARAVALGGSPW